MAKRGAKRNSSNLDEKVTAMVVSEFPLDSTLANTPELKDAKKGLVEYVKAMKPDVIFVDGLFQRMNDIETYLPEVRTSKPLENFMELPFKYGTDFLREIRAASPKTQIHYVLSDADEENMRMLTVRAAEEVADENRDKLKSYKEQIKDLNAQIREARKDDEDKAKRQIAGLEKKKTALEAELTQFELSSEAVMKKPKEGTEEWTGFKETTTKQYMDAIEKKVEGVKVSLGEIQDLNVNGCTFMYAHSFVRSSRVPLKSETGRLIGRINEMQRSNITLPDFIIEGGHHAEPMAHPHRHKAEHEYSLVVTGLVMEDQPMVKAIYDKQKDADKFQGKQRKLEACQRYGKKTPAVGVRVFGKDKEGFFIETYTAHHLAKIGNGSLKLEDMVYQAAQIVSDAHVGKKETDHQMLATALKYMEDELDACKKAKKEVPLFINPNESLQGANYKNVYTETKKPIPEVLARKLKDQKEAMIEKLRSKGEIADFYIDQVVRALDETNDPHLMNQVERYFEIFTDLVTRTIVNVNPKYDIAAVFTEATHIQHTIGEFGMSEVGLQTIPYNVADKIVRLLEKDGAITINKGSTGDIVRKGLYKRIKACEDGGNGYEKFDLMCGDNVYRVAAEHKPGSAGPNSNLPMLHVRRINSMEDDADVFIAGHLHTPYYVDLGRMGSNEAAVLYKGATFSDYSPYGIAGGWSSPVLGYMRAELPANKDGKGVSKVKFILSDFLKKKMNE